MVTENVTFSRMWPDVWPSHLFIITVLRSFIHNIMWRNSENDTKSWWSGEISIGIFHWGLHLAPTLKQFTTHNLIELNNFVKFSLVLIKLLLKEENHPNFLWPFMTLTIEIALFCTWHTVSLYIVLIAEKCVSLTFEESWTSFCWIVYEVSSKFIYQKLLISHNCPWPQKVTLIFMYGHGVSTAYNPITQNISTTFH